MYMEHVYYCTHSTFPCNCYILYFVCANIHKPFQVKEKGSMYYPFFKRIVLSFYILVCFVKLSLNESAHSGVLRRTFSTMELPQC